MPKKSSSAPEKQSALLLRIPKAQHRALKLLAIDREVRVVALIREALDKFLSKAGAQ